MRFRFALERLKRVRSIEERVARTLWAGAERAATEAEAAVASQREAVADARKEVSGSAGDPLDGRSPELSRQAIDAMLRALVQRRETALTARGQADRLADAWRERDRDKRGLAELEDRQRTRHRRETERVEARELDEIALARRKRREFDSSPSPGRTDEVPSGPDSPTS